MQILCMLWGLPAPRWGGQKSIKVLQHLSACGGVLLVSGWKGRVGRLPLAPLLVKTRGSEAGVARLVTVTVAAGNGCDLLLGFVCLFVRFWTKCLLGKC